MEQIEKISLLLGRIEKMEGQAVRLQKGLTCLVQDLSSLRQSLGGNESPFGVIYPHSEPRE